MKESAQNRLRRYNIKPSVQRMAVLDYLMTHHTHPTADTIFNALYPSIPTLSKATVYNTLNLLTEHGVIQMITIDEKNARFDARETPHLHFKCASCGEIFDFDLPPLQELLRLLGRRRPDSSGRPDRQGAALFQYPPHSPSGP